MEEQSIWSLNQHCQPRVQLMTSYTAMKSTPFSVTLTRRHRFFGILEFKGG